MVLQRRSTGAVAADASSSGHHGGGTRDGHDARRLYQRPPRRHADRRRGACPAGSGRPAADVAGRWSPSARPARGGHACLSAAAGAGGQLAAVPASDERGGRPAPGARLCGASHRRGLLGAAGNVARGAGADGGTAAGGVAGSLAGGAGPRDGGRWSPRAGGYGLLARMAGDLDAAGGVGAATRPDSRSAARLHADPPGGRNAAPLARAGRPGNPAGDQDCRRRCPFDCVRYPFRPRTPSNRACSHSPHSIPTRSRK